MGHWRVLLAGIVADPAQLISRLPLLAPDERRQLIEQWNATAVDTPQRCAHELFEEQAERTPQAVAVEIGEERMTRGLNAGRTVAHICARWGRIGSAGGLVRGAPPELVVGCWKLAAYTCRSIRLSGAAPCVPAGGQRVTLPLTSAR